MNFYTLNSKNIEGEEWNLNLTINADHPVYAGHFPQQAVAPGAMLTEMIKHIIEDETGSKLTMKRARNIKFLNVMMPEKAGSVDLNMIVKEEEGLTVQAVAKIGEDVYFKISAVYETL